MLNKLEELWFISMQGVDSGIYDKTTIISLNCSHLSNKRTKKQGPKFKDVQVKPNEEKPPTRVALVPNY
jgi:hypothetical protein